MPNIRYMPTPPENHRFRIVEVTVDQEPEPSIQVLSLWLEELVDDQWVLIADENFYSTRTMGLTPLQVREAGENLIRRYEQGNNISQDYWIGVVTSA
jgi:DNA/RNA-binding domain of Phe-tRNA-synthetase-like protein